MFIDKLTNYAIFVSIKRHGRISALKCIRETDVYIYASRWVASSWDYQISI